MTHSFDGPRSLSRDIQRPEELSESPGLLEVARVAHDANNLLQVACVNLELLAELAESAEALDLATDAHRSMIRVTELLRELMGAPVASVAASVLLDDFLSELGPRITRLLPPQVRVILVLRSRAEVRVCRGDLERVVMNLVVNAGDAMPSGGRLVLATRTRPGSPAGLVELVVSDTGRGMSRDVLDRAFDPHFTTKGHSAGSGWGLGLDIVRRLVRRMDGTIDVESRAGEGTEFRLRLPVCSA